MNTLVKLVLGNLVLAVLLASPLDASALMKFAAGKTYCSCNCATSAGVVYLAWEKVASCSLNGRACKGQVGGTLYPGTLNSCVTCTGDANGVCTTVGARGALSSTLAPPATEINPGSTTGPSTGTRLPTSQLPTAPLAR